MAESSQMDIDAIIKEGLSFRDKKGYTKYDDVFQEMAEKGDLELGDGWFLRFDALEYIGFFMSNEKYRGVIGRGFGVCPLEGCDGYWYGGRTCKHSSQVSE